MSSVGILGLGTYFPTNVRTNDYWSSATVDDWHDRMASRATRADGPSPETLTSGARRTLAAMAEYANDPFRGAVERRVMPETMTANDMEARAAQEAMERAGVRPDEVDVILTQTPAPEHFFVNSAVITHRLLGLPKRCLALATEAACNAFMMHLSVAQGMISSGLARRVLSVHSSAMTRALRYAEPDSAWWGDGAAAAVIGPVSDGKGILSAIHNADGANCHALVFGSAGQPWWTGGSLSLHAPDRSHTRSMLLNLVDRAGTAVGEALDAAAVKRSEVDFYASHQGTAWFTRATAAEAGLDHAKTVVTFPTFGNLNSANIPLVLAIAEREGMLLDGSIIATFAGGLGETWSSVCLRWGR